MPTIQRVASGPTMRPLSARNVVRAPRPYQRADHSRVRTTRNTHVLCMVATSPAAVVHSESVPKKSVPLAVDRVVKLDPSEVCSFLEGGCVTAVMFSAEHCGPCKMMGPEFKKLASCFPSFKFGFFSVSETPAHAEVASKLRVRAVPAFRVYINGRRLEEVAGARPIQLRQMLLHYYRPF